MPVALLRENSTVSTDELASDSRASEICVEQGGTEVIFQLT